MSKMQIGSTQATQILANNRKKRTGNESTEEVGATLNRYTLFKPENEAHNDLQVKVY